MNPFVDELEEYRKSSGWKRVIVQLLREIQRNKHVAWRPDFDHLVWLNYFTREFAIIVVGKC